MRQQQKKIWDIRNWFFFSFANSWFDQEHLPDEGLSSLTRVPTWDLGFSSLISGTQLLDCGSRSRVDETGTSSLLQYMALKALELARPALNNLHTREERTVQTHVPVSSICSFVVNIHDNDPVRLNCFIPLDLQLPDESIILQPSQAYFKPAEVDQIFNSRSQTLRRYQICHAALLWIARFTTPTRIYYVKLQP